MPLPATPLDAPPLEPEGDELPLALALPLEPASEVSTGLPDDAVVAQAPSSKKAVTPGISPYADRVFYPGLSFELRVIDTTELRLLVRPGLGRLDFWSKL